MKLFSVFLFILWACGAEQPAVLQEANHTGEHFAAEEPAPVQPIPHVGGRKVMLVKSSKGTVYADAANVTVLYKGEKQKGLLPGDTVLLEGNFLRINIWNISGTSEKPILFTNKGWATVTGTGSTTVILTGAHFKLKGDGDKKLKYGIRLGSDSATILLQLASSSNTEVAFVEFRGGTIGLQANQSSAAGMRDNYWHHNWFHDLGKTSRSRGRSEAFYIGYTKGKSTAIQENCRIENNLIENITGDAIQVNWGRYIIKDNIIRNWATAALPSQRTGIVLGGFVKAKVTGNLLENSSAKVLEIFADSADIQNNIFRNIDMSSNSSEDLIYVNSKINDSSRKMYLNISNNRFEKTKPNRKVIFVQGGSAYSQGIFVNNKGLFREDIVIPKGDVFKKGDE